MYMYICTCTCMYIIKILMAYFLGSLPCFIYPRHIYTCVHVHCTMYNVHLHVHACIHTLSRVQPGKCYHLFTQHQQSVLADYQQPEMLRTPLEELVLQIKILKLGAAASFLNKAIEPPSETAVLNALSCLRQLVELYM